MASTISIFDNLPLKKQQSLQRLYEMDEYAVLKEAIELLRGNAATLALTSSTWDEVKHLQGQAHGLKMLHQNLKHLHDAEDKKKP